MILSQQDAQNFLETRDGHILHRVRFQRDCLASHIELMSSTKDAADWIDDMIQTVNDGKARLLQHFIGNHDWVECDRVEALQLLCQRVAKIERAQVNRPALEAA